MVTDPLLTLGLGLDPGAVLAAAAMPPDPWQAEVLSARPRRALLVCSRQSGKSTTVAALCLYTALTTGENVVIVAPSQRQASELLRRVKSLASAIGVVPARSAATVLELSSGGRVIALPGTPDSVRGYTGRLLCLEEAAFLRADTIEAATPITATVPGASLVAISTPNGRQGWFYDQWENGGSDWHRTLVTADDCPRITDEFLATERASMPAARFRAEYYGEFSEREGGFSAAAVEAMFSSGSGGAPMAIGVDIGQKRDHAAIVVAEAPGGRGARLEFVATERPRLGTAYSELAERVAELVTLCAERGPVVAAVDATGVGAPVVETIRARLAPAHRDALVGATSTGGKALGGAWPDVTVPKQTLIDALRTALEQRAVDCLTDDPGSDALRVELRSFRPEKHVGDMAAAAALAVWVDRHVAATERRLDHAE